jgi:peptidylprolyl isomerase
VKRSPIAAVLCAAWLGLGPIIPALAADDPVVARLGTETITASEAKALLARLDPATRAQAEKSGQALTNLLRAELGRRAVLEQAKKAKWDQREDVAQQIARARDEIVFAGYLNSVAAPAATTPSDAELHKAYDANLSRFVAARQFHLAQIYVARPSGGTPQQIADAKAKAEQLDQKAKAKGADFAALAKASSEDKASAAKGGDLGWIAEDQLVGEVAQTVRGLRDEEVSDAIEAADGWHVVRELGTKPAGPRPFDEVKPQLVASLRQAEATRAAEIYIDKLLTEGHAAINEIALQQLVETPGQ